MPATIWSRPSRCLLRLSKRSTVLSPSITSSGHLPNGNGTDVNRRSPATADEAASGRLEGRRPRSGPFIGFSGACWPDLGGRDRHPLPYRSTASLGPEQPFHPILGGRPCWWFGATSLLRPC